MRPVPFPIREAVDDDGPQLIALIGAVFAEYPGCLLDVDGELPELRTIATSFRAWGGRFWVAEDGGRVAGCVGFKDPESAVSGAGGAPEAARGAGGRREAGVELCKLYVAKDARKRGLGGALCALVEAEARARGAGFVELWSDTRFTDAHRLYERRGYVRGPETRALHDISDSVEYYFRLPLGPA